MEIRKKSEGGITILSPIGDMGLYNLGGLRKLLEDLRVDGSANVVINMASVPGIDSTCIGFLLLETNRFLEIGGELKLAQISANVRRSLQMTETLSQLAVYENANTALASFRGSKG